MVSRALSGREKLAGEEETNPSWNCKTVGGVKTPKRPQKFWAQVKRPTRENSQGKFSKGKKSSPNIKRDYQRRTKGSRKQWNL